MGFCQSEEECRAASSNMGFVSFASGRRYRTKGCFSKNGKAFFSPGSEEEMSDTNLPAAKERIRCARQNTNTCLTAEDCIAQSRKMGFARFQQERDRVLFPRHGRGHGHDRLAGSAGENLVRRCADDGCGSRPQQSFHYPGVKQPL